MLSVEFTEKDAKILEKLLKLMLEDEEIWDRVIRYADEERAVEEMHDKIYKLNHY